MLYNVMYNSVIVLSCLNAFALGVPTNSPEKSIEKRALLDPPTLAAIALIEAQAAAAVAALLAGETAAILKIVG
ncbi:hypothetical protein JMJ35_007184 [Cladonia borealis]|uniref:Uncharacterized protein n=1 Tax=Cladonia borealis TaxID=184061 RepID=A0AA39QWX3_9LECA|nr:hypothetical protein JMJ35_007184 [Cladonia borealis]